MTRVSDVDDLFQRAFDDAAIGAAVVSLQPATLGRVLAANAAMSAITGRSGEALVGTELHELGVPGRRDRGRRLLERLMVGEMPAYRLEQPIVRADGEAIWVQFDASTIRGRSGAASCAVVHIDDVTERRRAAQRAEARAMVTRVLAQSSTVDGAISALVPALAQALGFEIGAAWTVDEKRERLQHQALWRSSAALAPTFCAVTREIPLSVGSGLPGRVWQAGEPLHSDQLVHEPGCPRALAAAADGLHSGVAFPIRVGARVAGAVELVTTMRHGEDADLLALLNDMSVEIASFSSRERTRERHATNGQLLLVEDNPFIARLVGEMLAVSDTAMDLVHVERLSEARDRLACGSPACVLLDLTLPDADGLQSLLEVRKLAPDVPIVVLTAHEDEDLALRAVREGAQDYLMKRKVDLHSLARSIRYAMERKGAEQQLLQHRLHDRLTGLPNRVLFLDRLRVALGRNDRGRVGVLLVNLDRFRLINDSLGHQAGDSVLLDAAERLVAACGPGATVAGLGGDEFAILMEAVDEREAIEVAERVGDALATPFGLEQDEASLTATLGIALNRGAHDAQQLVAEADTAMSRAKELGGNRYEVFEEGVRARLRERLRLETGLRNAIERGELRLVYQPIVALETREVVAFEALVRWEHPERGFLSPAEFMPVAEDSGLVVPMGDWVLDRACAQLAAWNAELSSQRDLVVTVNLSAPQVNDAALVDKVVAALRAHDLPPSSLSLEVTETALVEDIESSLPRLHALKALGVRLALDDFGTGYSSLNYLHRFPVDVLKLDRSFVAGLRDGESAIVAAVANMAKALGLPALAEGVEVEEDIERLRELGYTLGQGYHFARPQAAADALRLLQPAGAGA